MTVFIPTNRETESFIEDFRFFMKTDSAPILRFVPYNHSPFKQIAYHNRTAGERLRVLFQLLNHEKPFILVISAEAAVQRLIPKNAIREYAELLMTGEEIDRDELIQKMVAGGYTRTSIVEEPGDFSVRGGILDLFSPLYPEPLRVEMFGDLVESLRFFSASDQRTLETAEEAVVLPARETILDMSQTDAFVNRVRRQAADADISPAKVRHIVERIKKEGLYPGVESLMPLMYDGLDTIADYLPKNALCLLLEPESLEAAAEKVRNQEKEQYRRACEEGLICADPGLYYTDWTDIRKTVDPSKPIIVNALRTGTDAPDSVSCHWSVETNTYLRETIRSQREREKEHLFKPLADWISEQTLGGITVLLTCEGPGRAERLETLLSPYGIMPTRMKRFPEKDRHRGRSLILQGSVSGGFVWPSEALAIVTEEEIFGMRRQRKKRPPRSVRTELLAFEDLNAGDLVVHQEQGIGRYDGLSKLVLNGAAGDFLTIVYRDGDKLYLPVDRMSMVQKYMGVDGVQPVLDKMGGVSWGRVKERVKKSVQKIAGDLLRIYAERKVREGMVFETEGVDLPAFESGFPFEETPDQLKAISDVFEDMMSSEPMDRLICGDVGYGKTEVALRAAYLAVHNNKQVAVLVPTTVLAEQHYDTFSQRFDAYPVNVACLSRFRTGKEQRAIIKEIKEGRIDIAIGTHRLLQKDVEFKDLGLIVLDEEQRFGVRHKEKLKTLRSTVDVLTLTATPIPRTLHLSLLGIRDISLISTPPEDRHPVITYISEFEESVAADAIRRELERGGQIFFVHNNIFSIEKMARKLREIVPEVRADIAHGRMNEEELEQVMIRFMNREVDMLVCTSIIESGLDVPNANTILINRADRFGLAQIYQLRGRVGRGGDQAYAHLFIPREAALSRDAVKRLKVLMEHSDLGSGFQIAMSDLKIRGGGSILGASQSGHIAAVGYDMFLKLMEDAVSHIKGEPVAEDLEPEINIPFSAFISEDYIPDIDQRLAAYRRLSRMDKLKGIAEFKAELIDRFGPLPEEAANLLLKIMLKVLSVKAGVRRLDLTDALMILHFSQAHQKNPFGIVDLITARKQEFVLTPDHVLKAKIRPGSPGGLMAQAKNILKEIVLRVNG